MDKATMQGVVRRLKDRGLVDSRPIPATRGARCSASRSTARV
jgi:DNA-binding MarR family transcriptional regulator